MRTANLPAGDYRVVSATEPNWLAPNENTTFTIALSYHKGTGFDYLQNVNKMYSDIPLLQQFYNNGYTGGCVQPVVYCNGDCVYPGDTNADGIVNALDVLYMGCTWNSIGAQRTDRSSIFQPNTATAWTQTNLVNNLNRKHQDCNGDGTVNQADISAVNKNYGLRKADYTNPIYTPAGTALTLESNTPFLNNLDSIPQNFSGINVPVKVRLNGNSGQIQNFYGVAFTLEMQSDTAISILGDPYDLYSGFIGSNIRVNSLVDTSVYLIRYKGVRSNYNNNFQLNRKSIDVVIVRKDGQNFTGNAFDLMAFNIRRKTIIYNQTIGFAKFPKFPQVFPIVHLYGCCKFSEA